MKRLKLSVLCALALGTLIGLFNVSNGSKMVVQAQDAAKAAKPKSPTTDKPAEQPDQSAHRAAIDKTTQGFVEVFSRGDVEQVAGFLSEGAELVSDEAPPLRGRSAIVQALTDHFAEHPKKTITREVESLRFKSKLSVIEEGHLKVILTSLDEATKQNVIASLVEYGETLPPEYRLLLHRYSVADVCHRVVGVGSVGTRAYLVLLFGNGDDDPLFLQVKEAVAPAHAPYLPPLPMRINHEGRRVVGAQRELQSLGERSSCRRMMISNRYSPDRFGSCFMPMSSMISRSGLRYRCRIFS